jgi:hypothetical protein
MTRILALVSVLLMAAPTTRTESEAVKQLLEIVTSGCGPWLAAGDVTLEALDKKLDSKGWEITLRALAEKRGPWGRVFANVTQPDGVTASGSRNRKCTLMVNTNDAPWDTKPIKDAITDWVAATYPGTQVTPGTVQLGGRTLDAYYWAPPGLEIRLVFERAKQAEPDFDVMMIMNRR